MEGCLVSEDKLSWKVLLLPPDKDYIKGLKVADYIRWGEAQAFSTGPPLEPDPPVVELTQTVAATSSGPPILRPAV